MNAKLLSIRNLDVSYYSYRGVVHALDNVNLDIDYGETVGLVGETGCGKSTVGLAIIGLVPSPGRVDGGQILLEGEDLLKKSREEMLAIRRSKIKMIFQDPTTSLNPVYRIGDQIAESFMISRGMSKEEAEDRTIDMLSQVGIPEPEKVARQYPHELSGGMKQRAMIAIALAGDLKLLLADEPTSSLDVTIQSQILELMMELKRRINTSIMLITHNMGIVAQTCDRVAVMYAGTVVEFGGVIDVFKRAEHPYTTGLLESVALAQERGRLKVIPGIVPDLITIPRGCRFNPRCSYAQEKCRREKVSMAEVKPGHWVACHLFTGGR